MKVGIEMLKSLFKPFVGRESYLGELGLNEVSRLVGKSSRSPKAQTANPHVDFPSSLGG